VSSAWLRRTSAWPACAPALVALACVVVAWREPSRAAARERWPAAVGIVERAPSTPVIRRGRRVRPAHDEGRIRVRYQVRGSAYTSLALERGALSAYGDSSDAALRALRYPAGAPVRVLHDPRDPARAALADEADVPHVWMPATALALLLMAGVAALLRASMLGVAAGMLVSPFAIIGCGLLLTGAVELRRAWASTGWPTARGSIVFAEPEAARTEELATPVVYRYVVDGRPYFGNVRLFGGPAARGERQRRRTVGDTVIIRHAPGRPELAVLQPGLTPGAWIMPGVGALFLAVGLAGSALIMRTTARGRRRW
jgi:hypothetical protein